MPPRRPHSKSRLGCKECKQRRVKCDETHPICQNCERRDFDCSFQYSPPPARLNRLPPRSRSAPNGPGLLTPPADGWSPPQAVSDDGVFSRSRAMELRLMHQWSVETYKALAASTRDLWRVHVEVPELALEHDFLLDSMLCVTALHMAFLHPDEVQKYGDLAIAYQDQATTRFRTVLENPSAEQGPSMFWASCMVGIVTFALPRIYPEASSDGPTEALIHMARLTAGTAAIISLCKTLMGEEAWFAVFPDIEPPKTPLDPDVQENLEKVRMIAAEADLFFDEVSDECSGRIQNFHYGANIFMDRLQIVPNNFSPIMAWPVEIGPTVLARLEAGDSVARLIIMCYALMLQIHDDKWWLQGSAKELVGELAPLVMATNPEWHEIIDWLCVKIGLHGLS